MRRTKSLRIAAFGFRSFPPRDGSAGADKFALELLPRLVVRGHQVTAYNRTYPGFAREEFSEYQGVKIRSFTTVSRSGFDTLLHSSKVTYDIIRNDTGDVVHIQGGGNSLFGAILRLAGKKTFLSQDGLDWERDKWPWYAKAFLWLSSYLTASVHNAVIFDNIFARDVFEKRFGRKFDFIPFGSDVKYDPAGCSILQKLGVHKGEYFLFVGRFIPDKGLHWLIDAFGRVSTNKKLVLVGGSPNTREYETVLRKSADKRVIFPGFLYGNETRALMKHSYAYVQPSTMEGLSPVILEAAFLGAPVICSNIPQNVYALTEHAMYFRKGDVQDLAATLKAAIDDPVRLSKLAVEASKRVVNEFSWDNVADRHVDVFSGAAADK